jgi:hypothetical protein
MAGLVTGIASLAITAGTTAASFIQAGQQKRKQQDFEADAAKALAEARKKLQVNYAEAMSVNKEPYNQERLAMLSAGAQIAQAASESKRGVSAAAGQLLAQQQAGQVDISNRQGADMQNIQNAILEEESRLRDVNVGLDIQELAGNQQAAADAKLAAQLATQQGIQGIGNFAQQGLTMIPLYGGIGKGTGNAAGNLTAQATATPNVATGGDISKPMVTPQTFMDLNQPNNIQNKKDLIGQQILGLEAFASPEQATAAGYVYDATLGGYVLINKNINASLTNPTPNSANAFNLNLGG